VPARQDLSRFATRYERHYGNRLFRCYVHRPASIPVMLEQAIAAAPDAEALVAAGKRYSYAELGSAVERMGANLAALGVQAGDRVAMLLGNSAEFVLTLFAALRLGAIAVPLNTREQRSGLAYALNHCTASVLVYERGLADRLPAPEVLPNLRHSFVVGGEDGRGRPFETLLEPTAAALPPVTVQEEDVAAILYTSGTTGQPKGVMLTHLGVVHSAMHFEQAMGLQRGERVILTVPASHVTGLVAILLTTVRVAGCNILMRSFAVDEFLRLAAAERLTYTVMVPAMYNLCLLRADFDAYDLSAWRIGAYGGAPMPVATIARLREKLPGLRLMNAYGATETTSPTTVMPAEYTELYPDSIGKVLPCADVRIMNDRGQEVPPGEVGELWIAGPMVAPGYWNDPEASEKSFVAGYWRSGDAGSIDADGFVRIHDRIKDMIIRGGYNVYSAELENVIYNCPGVTECAVVGQPDPVLGEKIHAIVYSADGSVDAARIRSFCAERVADYKVPDFVTIRLEPLPRNANGKILKAQLRAQVAGD